MRANRASLRPSKKQPFHATLTRTTMFEAEAAGAEAAGAEAAGAEAAGAEDDAPALQPAPAPATSLEGVYFVVHRSADMRAVNGLCKEVASSLSCVHMSFEDAMNAESALPGSELSEYQAGQSSLLGAKALPQQLGARVLLRALGRVLTMAEPGRSQHTGARVIVSGFPRNKHAAVALREAMRSAGESADAADGAADGAAGRRVRALCVRGYGSGSELAGDTTLEQLVTYLHEHGTLVEVDGRGDEVVIQSRMHAALVEVDPASNPAAFLMRARPGAGFWPGATAQLLFAAPGAEAEAEAATLCAQLCAEDPAIHYIALPLDLARRGDEGEAARRGDEGEAAGGDMAAGSVAPLVAMRLLRSMALAAEAVPRRRLRFLLHGALPAEAEAEAEAEVEAEVTVAVEALHLVAASVALRGLLVLGGEGEEGGEGGGEVALQVAVSLGLPLTAVGERTPAALRLAMASIDAALQPAAYVAQRLDRVTFLVAPPPVRGASAATAAAREAGGEATRWGDRLVAELGGVHVAYTRALQAESQYEGSELYSHMQRNPSLHAAMLPLAMCTRAVLRATALALEACGGGHVLVSGFPRNKTNATSMRQELAAAAVTATAPPAAVPAPDAAAPDAAAPDADAPSGAVVRAIVVTRPPSKAPAAAAAAAAAASSPGVAPAAASAEEALLQWMAAQGWQATAVATTLSERETVGRIRTQLQQAAPAALRIQPAALRVQPAALPIQASSPGLLREASTVPGQLARHSSLPRISTAEIRATLGTPPFPLKSRKARRPPQSKLSMYQTTAPNPFVLRRDASPPPRTPPRLPRPRPSSPAWDDSPSPARSLP